MAVPENKSFSILPDSSNIVGTELVAMTQFTGAEKDSVKVSLDVLKAFFTTDLTFNTVANALIATTNGQYFRVINGNGFIAYRNDNGVATNLTDEIVTTLNDAITVANLWKIYAKGNVLTPTVVIDPNVGGMQTLTLTQPLTTLSIAPVTGPTGLYRQLTLFIKQGSGANKIAWPGVAKLSWSNELEPHLAYTANKMDIITLISVDDGAHWIGMPNGSWINA